MARFGKYDSKGAVEQESTECILSGQYVNYDNSIRERVSGTPWFYRVLGSQYHLVTDDMRAEWQAEAKGQVKPAVGSRSRGVAKEENES